MNTINENEVRLANLEAACEMRRAELMEIYKPLSVAVTEVLDKAIASSGSTKYRVITDDKGILRDLEVISIDGRDDSDRLVSIDAYFRRDWCADESKPRQFAFQTCGFGTVKAGDTKGVAYCLLVGYLAAHVQEIQDALNAIPEWADYDRALAAYRVTCREAEEFSRKMKEDAKNAAIAEVEKRLVVGAVVATQKVRKYDFDKSQSFYTGVSTMEVERVTAKLVFFKDAYRQYKKADVLNYLATGLEKGGWSFAADVDMSRFPYDEVR